MRLGGIDKDEAANQQALGTEEMIPFLSRGHTPQIPSAHRAYNFCRGRTRRSGRSERRGQRGRHPLSDGCSVPAGTLGSDAGAGGRQHGQRAEEAMPVATTAPGWVR